MLTRRRSGQASGNPEQLPLPEMVPKGILLHLSVEHVKPSPNNPRRLFDPEPLRELRESIKTHGVLVPITVYKLPGQDMYAIVDGERRYRCCVDLQEQGISVGIPANVVEAPDQMASLIYMFNIHAFREQWELMPTALSLRQVMRELETDDNDELHEVTGLGLAQIERCKKILSFPEGFQQLSMDPDPSKRIPSNFWVELHPVLERAPALVPDLWEQYGRDGITQVMVDKYRDGRIKSVIHFRRILEAIEVADDPQFREEVADRLRDYILTPGLETRAAFDRFILDNRKTQRAVGACDRFILELKRAKIDYTIEGREEILASLMSVIDFAQSLLDSLRGDEPPAVEDDQSSARELG